MIAFFRIQVSGEDVTTRFTPRLISIVMSHSSAEPARAVQIVLSDDGRLVRFPKTGAPVLEFDRVSYSGDRPVEHSRSWYRSDRYRVQMEVTATAPSAGA